MSSIDTKTISEETAITQIETISPEILLSYLIRYFLIIWFWQKCIETKEKSKKGLSKLSTYYDSDSDFGSVLTDRGIKKRSFRRVNILKRDNK